MPEHSQPLAQYLESRPGWVREVANFGVHSTHEHLHTEAQRLRRGPDTALWLHQYLPTDLAACGLSPGALNQLVQEKTEPPLVGLLELDEEIFAALPLVRHTGYAEVVRRSASLFGGSPRLTRENLATLIPGMREKLTPGYYNREFERAGLLSVQTNSFDRNSEGERLPVRRETCHPFHHKDLFIDHFLHFPFQKLEQQEKGIEVDSLGAWEALVRRYFEDDGAACIAVKCAIAYSRRLDFEPAERSAAEEALARQFAGGEDFAALRTFQNYGLRYILGLAGEFGLPVKFHTGHYAGPGAEPLHRIRDNLPDIEPLIAAFPGVRFILMHHAYPYGEAAMALAKSYANCYIDQCWAWAINPAAASRYLYEFLLGTPANKIFLFGGDYACLELTLGHLDLARQGLCITLERLVHEQWATVDEALMLAHRLCRLNQEAIFPALKGLSH